MATVDRESLFIHRDFTPAQIHPVGFIQDSDPFISNPSDVFAGTSWIDITGGAGNWVHKIRNVANDGWEIVSADFTTNLSSPPPIGDTTPNTARFTSLGIDDAVETIRELDYYTAGSLRWRIQVNQSAESGSNAGSNFAIRAYDDSGSFLFESWNINRATGITTVQVFPFRLFGTDPYFQALHSSNVSIYLQAKSTEGRVGTLTNHPFYVYTNAVARAYFDTSGGFTLLGALAHQGSTLGFFSATPISKPTVTGSRGGNAALASLMTALSNLGLVTDSTT